MRKITKKGIVGIIFVLVIMIVTFISFYSFLVSVLNATPELRALRDFKETVETVCAVGGPDKYQVNVFLPINHHLLLKKEGNIVVENTKAQASPAAVRSRIRALDCARGTAYLPCTVGPTSEGKESVDIEVVKIG